MMRSRSTSPIQRSPARSSRWCIGFKVETAEGAFRMGEDEPAPRVGAGLRSTLNSLTGR